MRNQNLESVCLMALFSLLGYVSHWIAVFKGTGFAIAVIGFVYVCPLLLDSFEALSSLSATNYCQYIIDLISVCIGLIYIGMIIVILIMQSNGSIVQIEGFLKWLIALLPVIFFVRKFYLARTKFVQNQNVAKGYLNHNTFKME